uniref:ubiquitinyl hydrolase 1 n=1 Tax=Rhizophora mucronata TaxID=61149 RepID=A0A2P2JUQ6_RHIMU
MELGSNGGILYHEVQEGKLCALHCVNAVLQGPFFSEVDLAALASDLDCKERQVMLQPGAADFTGDFLSVESHNVSLGGDFSIQVLQKALEVWDLQLIPFDSMLAQPAHIDPDLENAFICHLHDHWFCIRKVNGEWYNFNSLYVAPQHLSKFYLAAYLDSLRSSGWSIFLVRGNFPKEFPILSSEAANGYGQWLSPEDAERITKACNSIEALHTVNSTRNHAISCQDILAEKEDQDLKAAIAASLDIPNAMAPSVEDAKSNVEDVKPGIEDDKPQKEEGPQAIEASVQDDKPSVEDDKPQNEEAGKEKIA